MTSDINVYIANAIRDNDISAVKKLEDLGLNIFESGKDHRTGRYAHLGRAASLLIDKAKPDMFLYAIRSKVLYPDFSDMPDLRFGIFKELISEDRDDLLDVFVKSNGLNGWKPDHYMNLYTFMRKDCNGFKDNLPSKYAHKRAPIIAALYAALPFNVEVASNPMPLLMCAAYLGDHDLIKAFITEGPIWLNISEEADDGEYYIAHHDHDKTAKAKDARYLLSHVFASKAKFSEKVAIVNMLADMGLDLDTMGSWHTVEAKPRLSMPEEIERAATSRASTKVYTGHPSFC